jgi:hypothetical protein
VNRSTGLLLAMLLLSGCDQPNPRASVTVRLPPAKGTTAAPGFSASIRAPTA